MAAVDAPVVPATAVKAGVPDWESFRPLERLDAAVTVLKTLTIGAVDCTWNIFENLADRVGHPIVPRLPTAPLDGKVCVITGGNAGIGLATAEVLAARGAHVILACRSRERGEAAAAAIQSKVQPLPGCGKAKVEVMECDMASLKSVRKFCTAFNGRRLPLHLLVANAGIMSPVNRLETEDKMEMQFQVNFLSHWLMVHSLLAEQRMRRVTAASRRRSKNPIPNLVRTTMPTKPLTLTTSAGSTLASISSSSSGVGVGALVVSKSDKIEDFEGWGLPDNGTRVVMLSSLTHHAGILNWSDMLSLVKYDPFTSYGLSKLANAMTAVELQRRLDKQASLPGGTQYGCDSVTSAHPGVVDTALAVNFFKNNGVGAITDMVGALLMKTPANSGTIMGVAALAPATKVAGKYLVNGFVADPAPAVNDTKLAQQLWDVAEKLSGHTPHASLL